MTESAKDEDLGKRRHHRVPIELKVEYKKLNTFFSDYTRNISKGGTFIKTTRPLPIGTEFVFKLTVPSLGEPIELHGKVVWHKDPEAKNDDPEEQPGMGIRFLYNDDAQRTRFEGTVERLMRDSLGDRIYEKLMGDDEG